jgi:hypothetical protein
MTRFAARIGVLFAAFIAFCFDLTELLAAPPAKPTRLKVSASGRFLVQEDGSPFFWLGDTAWFIMRLSDDEIRYYLANRARKGFTGIQVDLNLHAWTEFVLPGEVDSPFCDNDPQQPNERYWRRADWMVDETARHGLHILLTPMWGKHYPRYVGGDTAKARRLGKWLGSRYRDRSHVMWFVSGEYDSINGYRPIDAAQKAIFNAVAQGLDEGHGGRHLSRPLLNRIPDQSLLASPADTGIHHVRATRASDGGYAMIYVPTGGTVALKMDKIAGSGVKASWFDPRTGRITHIGNFPARGTREFDAPGPTEPGNDWVLVLDPTPTPRSRESGSL